MNVPGSLSGQVVPGFFGKLPSRGDFLSRRVPPALAPEWERWLQTLTLAGRAAGPDTWLTAPLWHFALGAGMAAPYGAAGVLVASADRVGRLFPFTVIGPAAPGGISLEEWSEAAESLVLAALDEEYDPAGLDAALAALGPPLSLRGWDGPAGATAPAEAGWPGGDAPGPGQSVWWCRGSDHVPPVRLCCAGLPGPATCAAMIAGGAAVTPYG